MLEHGGPDTAGPILWDFSTNANPMGPLVAVAQALASADRHSYPEPSYLALRRLLADFGLGPVERLMPTAGNAEGIRRLSLAAKLAGVTEVWVPQPGYGEYAAAAQALGLRVRPHGGVADLLRQGPCAAPVRKRGLLGQANASRVLIWLCEPCNPTGAEVSSAAWSALVERAQTWRDAGHVLAVDRAYAPMRLDGADPVPEQLLAGAWQLWSPNKTLGCTGVRAGMLVAPSALPSGWPDVSELAPSWVLGSEGVALLAAWASSGVQAGLRVQREIWANWMRAQHDMLRELGWTVQPSVVPFFLAQPPQGWPVADVLTALRARGIKLRNATSLGAPGWCRLRVMEPLAQQALRRGLQAVASELGLVDHLSRRPQGADSPARQEAA